MSIFNAYLRLSGAVDATVTSAEPMSRHTTYRIGGPAALFVCVHNYKALLVTLEVLKSEKVEWVLLGKGSNILCSDAGFNGCVITLGREFSRLEVDPFEQELTVGAACATPRLVSQSCKFGLSGLEALAGIPGTVGGACAMNAGSRKDWIGPHIKSLVVLRPSIGLHKYDGSEIEWGYRSTSIPTSEIILECTLSLKKSTTQAVGAHMDSLIAKRHRTQPLGHPSCGSVFKNPPNYSVGELLDQLGFKGRTIGGARVSDVHANFIVNDGTASAKDVLQLMNEMHDKVKETYGIDLQPEVKFLGF